MSDDIAALVDGFTETIEYAVVWSGGKEARRQVRTFPSLLDQLEAEVSRPLPSRKPGCGGGSGGKAGSRPPIGQAYADLLDTIHEQALALWAETEEERPPAALRPLLRALPDTDRVRRSAQRWVERARVALGFSSRRTYLTDTVCGNCGGTLTVAVDATTDVRCTGTATTPPCGTVYGRTDWIALAQSS